MACTLLAFFSIYLSCNGLIDFRIYTGYSFFIFFFLDFFEDFLIFLKILFIHERQRERDTDRQRQRHRPRQREEQAPHREPDLGLDPPSPGSHPGRKAALNRCATRTALGIDSLINIRKQKIHKSEEKSIMDRIAAV